MLKSIRSIRSCLLRTGWLGSCLWVGAGALVAAPTLTITSAVVTNDYVGKITFAITGLAVGQLVAIQKWADVNGNGVIDANEPMLQGYRVTDGRVPRIAGVRSLNQPGDEDGATNGQITVELMYPGEDLTLDHIAGHYLYKIADPSVTPGIPLVTNSFTVVPKAYPQGVTGTVVTADTGWPLTNAIVVLT